MLKELYGSREVTISRQGMTGKRSFICDWWERYDVIPSIDSQFPDDDRLFLVSSTFKPEGQSKDGYPNDEYVACRVDCEYANVTIPTDSAQATYDFYTEILEVGGGRLWTTSGALVQQPLNIIYPKMREVLEMVYTITSCAAMVALVGKVNNAAFRGTAAGCVLFEGVGARLEWDGDAFRTRATFTFIHSDRNWNYFWNSDTGAWDTTNPLVYTAADFTAGLPGL